MILVVNADIRPSSAVRTGGSSTTIVQTQVNTEEVDKMRSRLDQFESSLSSVESQFYTMQKSLINDGAMRPYSARWDERQLSPGRPKRREARHDGQMARPPKDGATPSSTPSEPVETPPGESGDSESHNAAEPSKYDKPPTPEKPATVTPAYKYRPYIPHEQNEHEEEKVEIDHTPKVVHGDTVSIDPDFQQSQVMQEQQKPEEISIPKYEDQFRILREAVVELRTNLQILKVKSEQPVMMPMPVLEEVKPDVVEAPADDTGLRLLRRKIDGVSRDLEGQIHEVRRELYEFMARPRESVVERVVEVRQATDGTPKEKRRPEREVAAVKDINVELNLARAKAFLGEYDENKLLRITKLDDVPNLDDQPEMLERSPIVESPLQGLTLRRDAKRTPTNPQSPRATPTSGHPAREGTGQPVTPGQMGFAGYGPWFGPGMRPGTGAVDLQGHLVPQSVHDLTVVNARPRDEIVEILMPFLSELRSELILQIQSASDRIRDVESALPKKVDKEFVDAFFRKLRMALQEMNERVGSVSAALPDRVTKEELEERMEAFMGSMPRFQETTLAGKTSVTCLLCGSKRTGIVTTGIAKRGHIYRGRAAVGSSQGTYDNPNLPPLQVGDD
jgi:hypothetical protein